MRDDGRMGDKKRDPEGDRESSPHGSNIRANVPRAFRLDVLGGNARRRDTDEEIAFHIDMRVRQLMSRGLSEADARTEALSRFAGTADDLEVARHDLHVSPSRRGAHERLTERLDLARRDVRFALRSLWRNRGFSLLTVITLALGLGASASIFSVVRAIVLQPLPYSRASQLVNVQHTSMETVAPTTFLDWQRRNTTLSAMSAAEWWTPSVATTDRVDEVNAIRLTTNHIALLGVTMTLGRGFLPDDANDELTQVAVLSHAYWMSHFGGARDVIGKSIVLNGRAHAIVGVMPPRTPFVPFWADDAQLAVPLVFGARVTDREGASLRVLGRLRDNVPLAQSARDFDVVRSQMEREHSGSDVAAKLVPLHERVVGDVRNVLYGVMAAVLCVLMIACANVAHLQLMRNAARQREFAIRSAIGGTRTQLIRQSLVEGLTLTGVACLLGLVLARAGVQVLVAFAPHSIPRIDTVRIDLGVMGFALALAALVAIFFALLPALGLDTRYLQAALRTGASGGDGRRRSAFKSMLVISEFAMALVLLSTAGLVLRTVRAMNNVNAGFDASNVLTMRISTRGTDDSTAVRRESFYTRVIDGVAALQGVQRVGAINHLPLDGDQWHLPFIVEGAAQPDSERASATFRIVRPGYFDAMRIGILEGRAISGDDARGSSHVVVVSRAMAARRWPEQSAIGKRISVDRADKPDWFTVVGVAEDTRQGSWTEQSSEEMYFPNLVNLDAALSGRLVGMLNPSYLTLVIRTTVDPMGLARPVENVIRRVNPNATVSRVVTMGEVVDQEFASVRFYLTLFTVFAVIAISLALIGVYSVLSYSVARRRRELGVRLALGASQQSAFRLVLGQGMRMVAAGAVVGIAASVLLSQLIRGLLYGVQPVDATTTIVATLLLIVVATLGCAIPARRAARTDPLVALRAE